MGCAASRDPAPDGIGTLSKSNDEPFWQAGVRTENNKKMLARTINVRPSVLDWDERAAVPLALSAEIAEILRRWGDVAVHF